MNLSLRPLKRLGLVAIVAVAGLGAAVATPAARTHAQTVTASISYDFWADSVVTSGAYYTPGGPVSVRVYAAYNYGAYCSTPCAWYLMASTTTTAGSTGSFKVGFADNPGPCEYSYLVNTRDLTTGAVAKARIDLGPC